MSNELRLIDTSSPHGFRELVPANGGCVNGGFTEHQAAQFYMPSQGPWRFFIDDELLPVSHVGGREGWLWKPGFYAGTVRAEVIAEGELNGCNYLLDVTSDPAKLGQTSLQVLVQDILDDDPSLIVGDEPATHALGESKPTDNASVQYAYLFQHSSALLAALRAIEDRPRRSLEATRITVPLSRVRRADAHTARLMARNGSLAALAAAVATGTTTGERTDWRFNVPFSVESLDSAATRCVTALANAVLRRAIQVGKRLEELATSEKKSVFRTSLLVRWPRRREFVASLVRALDQTLMREPFRSVRRAEVTAAGLTAVAADPIYARAQRLAWKILRPGTAGAKSESWAWMSPTWDLYETWCFIRLRRVLQDVLPELTWKRTRAPSYRDCFEGTGLGIQVRLFWQPVFWHRADGPMQNDLWSISKELRPDFAVTLDRPTSKRWFILDAKYSQGRQTILDAMYSAHVYHDALRRFDEPPFRSLLLIPALGDDVDWLHERSFKDTHGVGIVTCSPDTATGAAIVDELRAIAGACSGH